MTFRTCLLAVAFSAAVGLSAAARPAPVTACIFTPDSASLIVAHQNAVIVRSAVDGSEQHSLSIKLSRITSLAATGDSHLLAIGGGAVGVSGKVILWDLKKSASIAEIDGFNDLVTALAFSPDRQRLAVASADKSAAIFDLRNDAAHPQRAAILTGHAGPILSILFDPEGKNIATASADRSIKVWDAGSGKLLRTLSNHTDAIHALALRPAANQSGQSAQAPSWTCASASDDQTVRVWQLGIGRMVRIVRKHSGAVLALAYSADGSALMSGGAEGVVRVIDADSDQILFDWKAHDDWIYTLAASPNGKRIATGDWEGNVRVWTIEGKVAKRLW